MRFVFPRYRILFISKTWYHRDAQMCTFKNRVLSLRTPDRYHVVSVYPVGALHVTHLTNYCFFILNQYSGWFLYIVHQQHYMYFKPIPLVVSASHVFSFVLCGRPVTFNNHMVISNYHKTNAS